MRPFSIVQLWKLFTQNKNLLISYNVSVTMSLYTHSTPLPSLINGLFFINKNTRYVLYVGMNAAVPPSLIQGVITFKYYFHRKFKKSNFSIFLFHISVSRMRQLTQANYLESSQKYDFQNYFKNKKISKFSTSFFVLIFFFLSISVHYNFFLFINRTILYTSHFGTNLTFPSFVAHKI